MPWKPSKNGQIPKNSFPAGTDLNGETIYIARFILNGDLIPGKVKFNIQPPVFKCYYH